MLAAKSLSPTPIELPRAEVLRVRRQAKELVFATLRALEPPRSIVPASNGDADWQQSGDVAPDDGCWYGKGGKDVSHVKGGGTKLESPSKNRARQGANGKSTKAPRRKK